MKRQEEIQYAEFEGADALALLSEREQWEADEAAIAEYESWYLQRLASDAEAETISELGGNQ